MKYSTSLVDEAIEMKRCAREEQRKKTIRCLEQLLDDLQRTMDFREAYLFGSLIKPYRFSEDSDIDIGFLGLKDRDYFKAMSFISNRIGLDVDIVQLEGHRLKGIIVREGIRWKKPA